MLAPLSQVDLDWTKTASNLLKDPIDRKEYLVANLLCSTALEGKVEYSLLWYI